MREKPNQIVFTNTVAKEIPEVGRKLNIKSKLHCGAIKSRFFPCSLLQTSNKVLVSHNVTLFVNGRHITYRSTHYFCKVIKCWTSNRLFWFHDARELNYNTRFRRGNLCWSSCKSSRNVGLRATVQLQAWPWNWLSNSEYLRLK